VEAEEKNKIIRSILYPSLFVGLLWAIKILEFTFNLDLIPYGLYPRAYSGLFGVITCPLIHSSFDHLFSNSIPLMVLGGITFYFYRPIAFSVFFWVYLMSGIWLWAAGREAYHVGASGLVYGFATFLFFSGIFRKERSLMVLSMLVTFLYGSLVWGIFPLQPQISWESHLLGSLAGIITAYYFRKEGPQAQKIEWNENEEDDGEWRIVDKEENASLSNERPKSLLDSKDN
jgi:membrane associated rhomboid family serine protease